MITKRDLECEIYELELEIKKHNEAIQNLNNIKERRTQKLKEMGNQPLDVIVIDGVKYRRVVEEPTPKPPTLYEKLELPYSTVMKQFNINYTVKVRLTKFGKELHKKQWEDFWSSCGRLKDFPYKSPEEDENGYVEFQMWELMEKFGSHCGVCKELAFETIILIDEKDLKDD